MNDSSTHLMDLPNELLLQILDDADPDDFESLVLSCRHFYCLAISISRIKEHNHCKRWPGIQRGKFFYMPIGSPMLLFLDCLMKMPNLRMQHRVLTVWKSWSALPYMRAAKSLHGLEFLTDGCITTLGVALGRTFHPDYVRDPEAVQRQQDIIRKLEVPGNWLHEVFLEIQSQVPQLQNFHKLINPNPHSHIFANEEYYLVLFLFALPCLQHLVLDRDLYFTAQDQGNLVDRVQIGLGDILASDFGRKHFRQLESITCTRHSTINLACLSPFLQLPRLKVLVASDVHEFNYRGSQMASLLSSYNVAQSAVKTLVLSKVTVGANQVASFFRPLESLRTLVWESGNYLYSEPVLSNRKGSFQSKMVVDSDDELDLTATGPEMYQLSGSESSLWQPNSLLKELVSTHGSRLQHLCLVCHETVQFTVVARREQIPHFKDFTHLTHLAIDLRILRTRIDQKLPSLTSVLPSTIQVVRIHMRERRDDLTARAELFTRLLQHLPEKRELFPVFRKIMIRTIDAPAPRAPRRRRRKGEDPSVARAEAAALEATAREKQKHENLRAIDQLSLIYARLRSVGIDISVMGLKKFSLTAITQPCWDPSQKAKDMYHDCSKCFFLE